LPSSTAGTNSAWRQFLTIPKPANAPAERPWTTLLVTIAAVVGVGSVILFRDRIHFGQPYSEPKQPASNTNERRPIVHEVKKSAPKPIEPKPVDTTAPSPQRAAALLDPQRLIVQPGTPLRNITDAIERAQDRQVIEVASNDAFLGEVRLPAISLTLVANPEFHPVFRNTVRVNGGGTIRVEGFHFEPYLANKPAIEVEKMPEKLQFAGCTFRGTDGVLIAVNSTAGQSSKRPTILLEQSFAAGSILFGLAGVPPDLQVKHSCLVVDQAVFDWQLVPGDAHASAACNMLLHKNTLVSRTVFHVRLNDQQRPISQLPRTAIHMDDNIFAFPSRYPCSFFRWEAWQRPDIVQDRFIWSGGTNAFCGQGAWSMAASLVLSDPGATPQVVMESPDDWQKQWAEHVGEILKVPPEFRYAGPPKHLHQISPADYELVPQSKQRELGSDRKPLGADIHAIPAPPAVK
jgi:hypothetical protein